ncbi:MAG: flagellar hook-length control protein FliK [Herminiimonas sp.]|nr:flagellar hook-length control protein FliK [Herminiimonas sp.]
MIDVRPLAASVPVSVSVVDGGPAQADPVTASAAAADGKALRAPTPEVKPVPLDTDPSKDEAVKPVADFAQFAGRVAADKLAASSPQADAKPSVLPATGTTELPVTRIADVAAKAAPIDQVALKPQDAVTPTTAAIMAPMQQAFSAVQAAAGQATEKLTPNVGTAAWDQALGQKVVWMVAGAHTSATLTLNPPDLGPMHIVLSVNNTDATATFVAAQPEVRQALEAAMPKLREMLAEAGIQLGQASVNAGSANQNGNNGSNRSAQTSGRGDNGGKAADASVNVTRIQPARSGLGMVDTFA